ncbi:ZIP family metal transporter [Rhodobium gokarnense]|uniref:ZIP family zinc transporter n=1 Tax=Rhodobium gokarnense TaxID=364296 RepID=A0ABT3H8K8_9HYPH|nr:hypothetical protein [Rhodobium gokarnense]MCW2306661.1 ZIP family zinc transporter [Rhodobium gokarnense]
MTQLHLAILCTTLAGAMIPLGAWLAVVERIRPNWLEEEFRHSVIAFGGGVLLAAISFVLVPEGIDKLPATASVAAFAAGGLAFFWLDRMISGNGGSKAQFVAMVSDFLPEALALGALFATGDPTGPLLAALIGLQNLPEGFNAYRELVAGGRKSPKTILGAFAAVALVGPIAAVLGHVYLTSLPELTGFVMLFAGGGILYLIFQDIAVQAHLERRWAPSLGAIGGYLVGLIGHLIVH